MSDSPSFVSPGPEQVNPERLSLVLQESGWTIAGRRTGVYLRLLPPEDHDHSVLVPLDRTAPEFPEFMRSAIADIQRLTERQNWTADVSARLVVEPSDSFHFRAESAAPKGLIAWTQGERLIESSRRILAAGAKTHLEHLRYFGNRFGQFANRYLNSVLMGQTVPGSYVVTAFTPANGFVQVTGVQANSEPLFTLSSEAASTRAIGVSIMAATEATREAIDHYWSRGSLSGFEALVDQGVSYEMTMALNRLVSGSDGADISVEWDPALEAPTNVSSNKVILNPSDVEVLEQASHQLASSSEPAPRVAIMGRVHLLTQREAGGPGVVGIENLTSEKPKKLRVHLSDEDYHAAVRAHDRNDAVVVEGPLEREGNIYWIYEGRLVSILGSIEGITSEIQKRPLGEDPGQLELNVQQDDDPNN